MDVPHSPPSQAGPSSPGAAPGPPLRSPGGRLRWLVGLACGAGVALLLTQSLVLTVCVVAGGSMEPTLRDGQRVLVLRCHGSVERGDLLVFRNPIAPSELLVKRVLGLPGERLAARSGRLFVGEREVREPYVLPGSPLGDFPASSVPAGHVFVLGDNRADSVDSRRFGAVDVRHVVGEVLLTLPGGS